MFPRAASESIPAFEPSRAFDLHLPVIVVARSENRDSPIPWLIMKHVLDERDNLRLVGDVPRIVQLNDNWHGIHSNERTRATRSGLARQRFILELQTGPIGCPDLLAT
jgi:hypothetical protein